MKHIVFCWEMGDGLGHLIPLVTIARRLADWGFRVTCVVKQLEHVEALLRDSKIAWLQAPRLLPRPNGRLPVNHAELIYQVSYGTSERVITLVEAWTQLLTVLRPDSVVLEAAPTARLAARRLCMPVMALDSGFWMPPLPSTDAAPLPSIRPALAPTNAELAQAEERTLTVINEALSTMRTSALSCFSQLFDVPVIYRNWMALNHFGPHSQSRHFGQLLVKTYGPIPQWASGKGPKLFAYVKRADPDSARVLAHALERGYRVTAYLPDFTEAELAPLRQYPAFRYSAIPYNLAGLDDDVEVGIWHSPTGAVARCMRAGIKMLFLPRHPEQMLACNAVRRSGFPAMVRQLRHKEMEYYFDNIGSLARLETPSLLPAADLDKIAAALVP